MAIVSAAGSSWTRMTANATWAPRLGHTSVIDAAGHIYVIGGFGVYNNSCDNWLLYNDVWRSADQGDALRVCTPARAFVYVAAHGCAPTRTHSRTHAHSRGRARTHTL
jgi:hypothetical protein